MKYSILLGIIIIALVVIGKIFRDKIDKVKNLKEGEKRIEKQIKVKQKLLEAKLEKKLFNFASNALDSLKNIFSKSNKAKTIIGVKEKYQKKFALSGVFKKRKAKQYISEESVMAGKLLEGQTSLKKKELDEAESKFIKVLEYDPKNIQAYMGLGEIYSLRKEWDTAEEAYRCIIKIDSKFFDGYRKLAINYEVMREWLKLRELGEEVLEMGCRATWVYSKIGLTYKKTGYPEKAEEYYKKAVECEPQNEILLDSLIEVAIINKNKVLAKKAFNTLKEISRDQIKLQGYRDKIDIL